MPKTYKLELTERERERINIDVYMDGDKFVCEYDGVAYEGSSCWQLDSRLTDACVPAPRNLYFRGKLEGSKNGR
jgi:hypothetical protein